MVSISHETPQQCHDRLLKVISPCDLQIYSGSYAFLEFPLSEFPVEVHPDAPALVRDDTLWSQLTPCTDPTEELFTLFRFHFPAGVDNSGFVSWLATHIKEKFGSGVFVVCGQNRKV